MNHIAKRINSPGPKRILSCDGGGIRGALTLGYLAEVEQFLRQRHNNPNLLLCDYFDVMVGTSTGSIIATCLAMGLDIATLREKYIELGKEIFSDKKGFLISLISKSKFNDEALERHFRHPTAFGDTRTGDDRLRTCFVAMAKRVDTNSLWTITNNPGFKYYDANKHIPIWRAIKASSSPPTVFPSVEVNAFSDEEPPFIRGAFTDGGISMAGNPALQMLIMSQAPEFGFNFKPGKDDLFMLSMGSGTDEMGFDVDHVLGWKSFNWITAIVEMFLNDSKVNNEMMMQLLSHTETPRHYDRVMGFLQGVSLTKEPMLTYTRYNFPMSQNSINSLGGKFAKISLSKAASLRDKVNGKNAEILFDIGREAAKKEVKATHFPVVFDLKRA